MDYLWVLDKYCMDQRQETIIGIRNYGITEHVRDRTESALHMGTEVW